jgi:hypothetical protein
MLYNKNACGLGGFVNSPPRGESARVDFARPEVTRYRRKVRIAKHGAKAFGHLPILTVKRMARAFETIGEGPSAKSHDFPCKTNFGSLLSGFLDLGRAFRASVGNAARQTGSGKFAKT